MFHIELFEPINNWYKRFTVRYLNLIGSERSCWYIWTYETNWPEMFHIKLSQSNWKWTFMLINLNIHKCREKLTVNVHIDISEHIDALTVNVHIELYESHWQRTFTLSHLNLIDRERSRWVIWFSLTENVHMVIAEPGGKLTVNVHIELSKSHWAIWISLTESIRIELSESHWQRTFTLSYLNLIARECSYGYSWTWRQIDCKRSHWVILIKLIENVHIDLSEPGDKLKMNVHIELYEPEDKLQVNVHIELSEYKWRWTFTLNYLNLSTHSTAKAANWWLK